MLCTCSRTSIMEVHLLFLCLASFCRVVWTQQAEHCDLFEEYLDCGSPCPLTCKNYQDTVFCNKQCTKGCFCKHGYVKGPDGKCILPQNCPIGPCLANEVASQCMSPCSDCFHRGKCLKGYCSQGCDCISGHFRNSSGLCVPASECDVKESQCPIHEHFVSCVNLCNDCWSRGDCEQPYCQPGCDCLPGYFRNDEGDCIPESQCIASLGCGLNEEYSDCVVPCNDCEHRGNCDHHCEYGCDCKSGFYRNKQGVCVPAAECSMNAVEARGCRSCGHRCKADEQFYICVPTCRTTCANFRTSERQCSPFCTPGCFCKPGLVRNHEGRCVPPQECPEMCPLYEEYSDCGPACPITCSTLGRPVTCVQRCTRGCFCINGYVRGPRGNCIKSQFCPNNCKANEEYKECGSSCPKTCDTLHLSAALCDSRCVKGCFCKEGFVKGPDGACILPAFCPVVCPDNEVYQQCGRSCQVNCRNLATANAPCPQPCIRGCFCRRGFVRGPNGKCIPQETCPPVCKENEEYQECGQACQPTCDNRRALSSPCPFRCIKGCFCKRGFVRGPGGSCIPLSRCPVDCTVNEEFKECGPACPEECAPPRNTSLSCHGPCVRGCFCKKGLVRAQNGRCVRPQSCQVCKENEIFRSCGSACPANCTNQNSERVCQNDCVPGCFCKDGLVRGPDGRCIPIQRCPTTCRENEVYQECGRPCQLACTNITRSGAPCHLPCTKGCFCRNGFVRDPSGRCVRPNQCPIVCMENEEFKECGSVCTANCTYKNPPQTCNLPCVRGCFCKRGLIRGPNGRCISPALCPERCRENEDFKECGSACPASCLNRISERVCTLQCIRGCSCRDGFVKDPNGRCIPPDRCPPTCPTNEEYRECGTACPANCSSPNGKRDCTRECVKGCFCRNGFIRGPNGVCIPPQQCPRPCGENEIFKNCGSPCQITCRNRGTTNSFSCVNPCISGCFCRDGFVRGPGGRCIPPDRCPVVDDCKPNEVFKQCGSACPANCTNRDSEQRCPIPCIPGCVCRDGFVRGPNRDCIPKQQCPENPCPKPNEKFLECGPACIRTCPRINSRRKCPQICVRGCFCEPRYVRDINGNCVRPEDCPRDPQQCPANEQFYVCKPCLRTCEYVNLKPTCSDPCRPGCDCSRGFFRNREGRCVSPRNCPRSLVGRRGGNETEDTPEPIFTDEAAVLTTIIPPQSTGPIKHEGTSQFPTSKPSDSTLHTSSPQEILPRTQTSAPLDEATKTHSSLPSDVNTNPSISLTSDVTNTHSSPSDLKPGSGISTPTDTTPKAGHSIPSSSTLEVDTLPSDILPTKHSVASPDTTPLEFSKSTDGHLPVTSSVPASVITTLGHPLTSDRVSKHSLEPVETTPKLSSASSDFKSTSVIGSSEGRVTSQISDSTLHPTSEGITTPSPAR